MSSDSLLTGLVRQTVNRAHLYGGEAAGLEAEARQLLQRAAAARRRYWRELAAAEALQGHPWADAERLGAEP
jgi:hypothetical protein